MRTKWFAYPYIVWMILFTLVPVLLVAYYAFTNAPDGSHITLEHIMRFADWTYIKVLLRSVGMALLCTVICLIIGYPVAHILAERKTTGFLAILVILPMWMNFLLRTYAWMSLLENTGIINALLDWLGFGQVQLLYNGYAVELGMVYNFLPFMILPIMTVLQKMDKSYIEAAEDLGASPFLVFTRVTLPMAMPGIISGITMVFMPAVTTFVVSKLLGGAQFMLFGDLIEMQFIQNSNWNFGSALSFILVVIMLVSMWVLSKTSGKDEGRFLL